MSLKAACTNSEFQASLSYVERPFLKAKQKQMSTPHTQKSTNRQEQLKCSEVEGARQALVSHVWLRAFARPWGSVVLSQSRAQNENTEDEQVEGLGGQCRQRRDM